MRARRMRIRGQHTVGGVLDVAVDIAQKVLAAVVGTLVWSRELSNSIIEHGNHRSAVAAAERNDRRGRLGIAHDGPHR